VSGAYSVADFPASFVWSCKGLSDEFACIIGIGNTVQTGPDRFDVTVNYSTDPSNRKKKKSKKDPAVNPLDRPVIQRWGTGYKEPVEKFDLYNRGQGSPPSPGRICQASNGEPYAGVPIRYPYLIKTFIRNESTFNETACLASVWHMDSTHKILCAKFEGSEELTEDNGTSYYVQTTYEFWKLDPSGSLTWDVVMLDAGCYSWDTSTPPKRVFPQDHDGTKSLVSDSVLLDGQGHLWTDKDHPKSNTFQVHLVSGDDFDSLGLPI
jgi:hypothetical protein